MKEHEFRDEETNVSDYREAIHMNHVDSLHSAFARVIADQKTSPTTVENSFHYCGKIVEKMLH